MSCNRRCVFFANRVTFVWSQLVWTHHSGSLPPSAHRCTLCSAPSESRPAAPAASTSSTLVQREWEFFTECYCPPLLISTCRVGGTWDIVGIIVAGVAVDLSSGFMRGDRAHNVGLSRRVFRSFRWTWPYQMSAADKAQGVRLWRLLTAHSTWLCVSHTRLFSKFMPLCFSFD